MPGKSWGTATCTRRLTRCSTPWPLIVTASWWQAHGLFTGYWRAALCAHEGMPCVLGHALDMKAIHGGKATHDRLDAPNIAALRRGGMLPQA
jgi:hypothetical protein